MMGMATNLLTTVACCLSFTIHATIISYQRPFFSEYQEDDVYDWSSLSNEGSTLADIDGWKSVLSDDIKICPTAKNYCEHPGALFVSFLAPRAASDTLQPPCHINSHSDLTLDCKFSFSPIFLVSHFPREEVEK